MSLDLYDMLIARSHSRARVRSIMLGLSWSVCRAEGLGLCFSPSEVGRTLPWSGTLRGRSSDELTPWIRSFSPAEATVGALLVNAAINGEQNALLRGVRPLSGDAPGHLRVFAELTPRLAGARVAVVGRYPGLDVLWREVDYQCLERRPGADVLPDSAAEYVLPRADWVFLTGSAIANKTLPRLLELSRDATVVLMGPSVPWLEDWAELGVDYLAGVVVTDENYLLHTAAEGGGTRIFDGGVAYGLTALR